MRRMKKPMPIKPRARKVSFCQVFLKYNRKTKLVTTAAMQVPSALPVQMKLICLLGTPTFETEIILRSLQGIVYSNEQVIDLGCQKRLCGPQYAHGQAETDMASPGEGEIGGEPNNLPRAAHPPPPSPSPAASKSPATLLPASVQIGCSGALEF